MAKDSLFHHDTISSDRGNNHYKLQVVARMRSVSPLNSSFHHFWISLCLFASLCGYLLRSSFHLLGQIFPNYVLWGVRI